MGSAQFIAASKPLKEALKSANLLKSLQFNTLVSGEPGTGRHTLARIMMPDAPIVHGDDEESLYAQIEKQPKLIVDRLQKVAQPSQFYQSIRKHGVQVVAIAPFGFSEEQSGFFSVRIVLPPLAERPEDVPPLAERFKEEVLRQFGEEGDFSLDYDALDLSCNAFSLRRSVTMQYLARTLKEEEALTMMERYLDRRAEGGEALYRSLLYLYEVPLIRVGMRRFKSQLKMADAFGLNRNTLRKKIQEWRDFLAG
ncbi:Fis family transcriptional regulator [Hydrogenimonas sp.]